MYETTHAPADARSHVAVRDHSARLNWLLSANAEAAEHARLFRNQQEEEELLLMRRPLSIRTAYALFGMLLGTFPPAAIFTRLFGYGLIRDGLNTSLNFGPGVFRFCVVMNIICAGVGLGLGSAFSSSVGLHERRSVNRMLLSMALIGMAWGSLTGAIGGVVFFGIGAIFGALCAIPVAVVGFPVFTLFHRLLARGGMIDARHFWPLALSVTLVIAMLILNL